MKHSFRCGFALALLSPFLCSCNSPSSGPLKVGVLLGLSDSRLGEQAQARAALEAAIAEIDATAGRGAPIRLVFADSHADPEAALRELRRLIASEKVPVVIAASTSDEVLKIAPQANHDRTVLIATAAGSEDVRQAGEFIYRTVTAGGAQVRAVADRMRQDLGSAQVAVVASDRAFSVSASQIFVSEWLGAGEKVSQVFSYSQPARDFPGIVRQLAVAPPAAIYYTGVTEEAIELLRQVRTAGIASRLYVTGRFSKSACEGAGGLAEGVVFSRVSWDPADRRERAQTFVRMFRRRTGEDPGYEAASSYDALLLVIDALRAGARTGDEIRRHFDQVHGFPGVQGDLAFDRDGEVNLRAGLAVWRRGRLEAL